jgi:hypothetical protein
MKSFRRKDGSGEPPAPGRNGERDFHGEKRSNETHASTTDPGARLHRKGPGQPAKLAYLGPVLIENRHALVVDAPLTLATGTAEREAALEMVADGRPGRFAGVPRPGLLPQGKQKAQITLGLSLPATGARASIFPTQ